MQGCLLLLLYIRIPQYATISRGAEPQTAQGWVANLNPRLFLLSVVADDPKGRRDREALEALTRAPRLRTDEHGRMEVSSDGERRWVQVER